MAEQDNSSSSMMWKAILVAVVLMAVIVPFSFLSKSGGKAANGDEADLRSRLRAPAKNLDQALYVSDELRTGRVMVKDEDLCLHCGLCAERCPTGAWDMRKFYLDLTHAGPGCRKKALAAAQV